MYSAEEMSHRETFERAPFIVTGLPFLEAHIAVEMLENSVCRPGGRGKKAQIKRQINRNVCNVYLHVIAGEWVNI